MCIRSTDGFWRPWVQVYITPRFGVGTTSSTQWSSLTGGGNRRLGSSSKNKDLRILLPACLHGSWLHQRSTWLGSCQLLQLISKLVRKLWIVMDYEGEPPVDHPPPAQQSCCTQSLWDHWSRKAWISSMQNIHEMVCLTMRKYKLDPLNISQWENWSKTLNIIGPTIPLERSFPCDII